MINELMCLLAATLMLLAWIIKCRKPTCDLPPGPRGLPIVGYLPWLDPENPHLTLTALSRKYGRIFGLFMGSIYTVVLSDVKLVKKVLAMEATTGRAPLYLTHGVMEGYGLICAEGNLWKDQRKFMATYLRQAGASKFGAKRDELEQKILRQVAESIAHIKLQVGTGKVTGIDPTEEFYHTIGSFMNELVFGVSYARDDKFWLWIKHLQDEGLKYFGVAGPVNFLSFLKYVPKYKKVFNFIMDGKKRTHEIYKQIIAEQQTKRSADAKRATATNVIEAFLSEREKLAGTPEVAAFYNDKQFTHLLADVFGAGLHTTLTTICWYCLHMAANQEVQAKVHEELDSILQGRTAVLSDQHSLPCAMASIAEVQRFSTVVPIGIPHGALEDIVVDGYTIPKGAMIVPLQWAIHNDPAQWDQPEKFKLEHFLNKQGEYFKPEAFIPYQTGKRMCIGDELARMLLFLFIVNLMNEFRITCDGEINFKALNSVTYSPLPQNLLFTPRRNESG